MILNVCIVFKGVFEEFEQVLFIFVGLTSHQKLVQSCITAYSYLNKRN